MLVKSITEEEIYGIGHAFGYYDYGEETGMSAAFSGKEATANYICAYVRGVLRGGFLHTTSERSGASLQDRMDKEKKPYILSRPREYSHIPQLLHIVIVFSLHCHPRALGSSISAAE